jgi:hypothetical protein
MGIVHRIEDQWDSFSYTIVNEYSGERTAVTIAEEKRELFSDRSVFHRYPEACPFLRFDATGLAHCTVYPTWPAICREFGCWRLLILGPEGLRKGRVMGSRHLASDDPRLLEIWDGAVRTLPEIDDRCWDEQVIAILSQAGYSVRR